MGRLLRNILLNFAQFEREMTADRTRDKMYVVWLSIPFLGNGPHPGWFSHRFTRHDSVGPTVFNITFRAQTVSENMISGPQNWP